MDREDWWLQFIGSQRLRTNWSNWACTHTEGVKGFELWGKSVWFRSKWEESSGVWARLGRSSYCRVVPFCDSGWRNISCSPLVSFARMEKSFGKEWESISRTVIHVSPRWIYQLLSKGGASGRDTWCPLPWDSQELQEKVWRGIVWAILHVRNMVTCCLSPRSAQASLSGVVWMARPQPNGFP